MESKNTKRKSPNYGLDAPTVVRNLALAGIACMLLSLALPQVQGLMYPAVSLLGTAGVMIWGSRRGKLRLRDSVLDGLALRGDERVLDVGCGHGLMLIGAAKRLTTGKAVGVDIWQTVDQAGNRAEATWENVRIEGVADRVEIKDGDARKLPFDDASFDLVVSSWALHNIPDAAGREQALREIVRVLKPRGRLAMLDISYTKAYVVVLRAAGMEEVERRRVGPLFVILTHLVSGRKPAG